MYLYVQYFVSYFFYFLLFIQRRTADGVTLVQSTEKWREQISRVMSWLHGKPVGMPSDQRNIIIARCARGFETRLRVTFATMSNQHSKSTVFALHPPFDFGDASRAESQFKQYWLITTMTVRAATAPYFGLYNNIRDPSVFTHGP